MPSSVQQLTLFDAAPARETGKQSTTFSDNVRLPVHRWFRYSAGFSASWAEQVIAAHRGSKRITVIDPFAGSGTTLLAAQDVGVDSIGIESHPFVARVARAKLHRSTDPIGYRKFAYAVLNAARDSDADIAEYPALVQKCYREPVLADLDRLRRTLQDRLDSSPAAELTWLTLVGILRVTSHVGTANWQYVLPRKEKKSALDPFDAFERQIGIVYRDMQRARVTNPPQALLIAGDARTCAGVNDRSVDFVVTSPPYPNNYDYADATRLEMSFLREIEGWGDLQQAVRQYLVRSCSQHVREKTTDLDGVLSADELSPIREEITQVCGELSRVRLTKGGRKTYHLMVGCYFLDLAQVWQALRRVCSSPSTVCFVVGDSAPYGVYVPVMDWLGKLALAAGFSSFRFERTRDRNVKWKNRKHRVPLCEGRLWVRG